MLSVNIKEYMFIIQAMALQVKVHICNLEMRNVLKILVKLQKLEQEESWSNHRYCTTRMGRG